MSLRFGTDGVRGVALTELTTEFAASLGRASAQALGGGRWLVGRDPRSSGAELERAVASGLVSAGAEVVSLGVVPTPMLAWLSQQDGCPAAMVTASHNPWHDNGVKVFAAGGAKLSDEVEQRIEAGIESSPIPMVDVPEVDERHRYVAHLVDGRQRLDGLRVVIDCANGAMSVVAPEVFTALGADAVVLHADPDGRNINDACGATHTDSLQQAVVQHGAALGLAFDGDGDRVIAVDHLGRVVDGDRLIAMSALQRRDEGRLAHDTVVVTVMSNLGFHRAMQAAGVQVVTTPVGDRHVLEALEAGGFSVGGEQSGHVIHRDLATTGDGLLAGLELVAYVQRRGRPLAELAESVMTRYPQVLVNVTVRERHPDAARQLAAEIEAAERSLGDGRVLVRASGTEPIVRVMVEAATDQQAADVAHRLAAVVAERWA